MAGGRLMHPALRLEPLLSPAGREKGFGKAGWLLQPAPCPCPSQLLYKMDNTHTLFTVWFSHNGAALGSVFPDLCIIQ